MEKHRELIAAVAGYIIGGTTMFIAFGIEPSIGVMPVVIDYPGSTQSAAVANSHKQAAVISDVQVNEDGLFVKVGNEEKVVSVTTNEDVVAGPGSHIDISYYEVSPDATHLFYCAIVSSDTGECAGFIYNAAKHSVSVIKDSNGKAALLDLDNQSITWDGDKVVLN